jgi:hypothetical protein
MTVKRAATLQMSHASIAEIAMAKNYPTENWSIRYGRGAMGKKTKTAIYHPPKASMPYLVVTVTPDGISAVAVSSKDEARTLASKTTRKVELEDARSESPNDQDSQSAE